MKTSSYVFVRKVLKVTKDISDCSAVAYNCYKAEVNWINGAPTCSAGSM